MQASNLGHPTRSTGFIFGSELLTILPSFMGSTEYLACNSSHLVDILGSGTPGNLGFSWNILNWAKFQAAIEIKLLQLEAKQNWAEVFNQVKY